MKFKDKLVIVTGASRGIGRSLAIELAKQGANLVVTSSQRKNSLLELSDEVQKLGRRSIPILCDVSKENDVINMIDKSLDEFGRIDVLINNAGISGPTANVADMCLEEWNHTFAVNITGMMLCCREVLKKYMIPNRNGNIINVGSNLGKRGLAMKSAYVCTKWAVVGFTQTLAREVAGMNIRVNNICPGAVEGVRANLFIEKTADNMGLSFDEAYQYIASEAILGRLVKAEEVVSTITYLASDEASGITGQSINVCGGTVFN